MNSTTVISIYRLGVEFNEIKISWKVATSANVCKPRVVTLFIGFEREVL